jgi:hypothetical protein
MPDRSTPVETRGGDSREPEESAADSRSQLQRELDLRDEEILRLRDLLIGKDAELGAVKGRLAELEAYSGRLANAGQRLQARVPGATRLLGAGLRRLRGRRS